MCVDCFESLKVDPNQLDTHYHAPFSPTNIVAYHPYTQKWAAAKKLKLDNDEESEEWTPTDKENESDEDDDKSVPAEEQTDGKHDSAAAEQTERNLASVAAEQTPESNQVNNVR